MVDPAIDAVQRLAWPLDVEHDMTAVLDRIGNAKVVLIGDPTHGTYEFYRIRAAITQALISQRGFNVIAIEADWPDAYRANRWVRLSGSDATVHDALSGFTRFPPWMWRNRVVVDFLRWLHVWNAGKPPEDRTGFYGLDLYNLHRSIAWVMHYLEKRDPEAARLARRRYSCFDIFGEDVQAYGYGPRFGLSRSCEKEVVEHLVALQRRAADQASQEGAVAADESFVAARNADIVRNAEMYYREMFRGGAGSWNVRDRHMAATLEALLAHLPGSGGESRAIVWAHNSHVGDARATGMAARGEVNLGQLARERFGDRTRHIGFTTHTGTMTAAPGWDEPAELMTVRPSRRGSYERLFHDAVLPAFVLDLSEPALASALTGPRLERAIGVIYHPDTEHASHYFAARLPLQFDLVIHVDTTRAVEPLEKWSRREIEPVQIYPAGV